MRHELGDKYCDDLRGVYEGRVKGAADLVLYWFEKGREVALLNHSTRVGLLGTQGIRGGANRFTLDRINAQTPIFWAMSDRRWIRDGAMVHISMVAFEKRENMHLELDGRAVQSIFSNLTSGNIDTTQAARLQENRGICFEGGKKHGKFEITEAVARRMLTSALNPNGRSNADVVRPWVNALDITRRPRNMYIVDFGTKRSAQDAALYEMPFELLKEVVFPARQKNRREGRKRNWWLHGETNPGMRLKLALLKRYVLTPRVSKHRLFVWQSSDVLPDSATCAFARADDYFFGVLQSHTHEFWANRTGTQLREFESGFRYTPKTTFDTFPFPWPPGKEPQGDPRVKAIAAAAKNLVDLRDRWLNPPDTPEAELKKRTLTNLYNARPQWLQDAHRTLDHAVFAAYGWPTDLTDQQILERLLTLNHERAAAQS